MNRFLCGCLPSFLLKLCLLSLFQKNAAKGREGRNPTQRQISNISFFTSTFYQRYLQERDNLEIKMTEHGTKPLLLPQGSLLLFQILQVCIGCITVINQLYGNNLILSLRQMKPLNCAIIIKRIYIVTLTMEFYDFALYTRVR